MKFNRIAIITVAALSLALGAAIATPADAQEVLPRPQPAFKGKIGRTAAESKTDFPKAVAAPKGAPNVLLILTDDVGFGALEIAPIMVYFIYRAFI